MTDLKLRTSDFPSQVREQTSFATQEVIVKSGSEKYASGSEAEKCHANAMPMPCHAPSRPFESRGRQAGTKGDIFERTNSHSSMKFVYIAFQIRAFFRYHIDIHIRIFLSLNIVPREGFQLN